MFAFESLVLPVCSLRYPFSLIEVPSAKPAIALLCGWAGHPPRVEVFCWLAVSRKVSSEEACCGR